MVKLNPTHNPLVVDYFTPYNQVALDDADLDFGSGAPLVITRSGLIVGGGKNGEIYVNDENNLGHYNLSGDTQIVQSWQASYNSEGDGRIAGGAVYWQNAPSGLLYIWPAQDYLKAFPFTSGKFQTTPISQSTFTAPVGCRPSCRDAAALSLSSNGVQAGTGILWASLPSSGSYDVYLVPGILRAFDATDLTKELWNSNMNPSDGLGIVAKFAPPTVVGGKVYVPTFSGSVNVYGLLPAQ